MANMKSLFKDTAVYGVSTILGRFINWCLAPLYTFIISSQGNVGKINWTYALLAILIPILTYGMETGYFRFVNNKQENSEKVYSTALGSVSITSILFILCVFIFIDPISALVNFSANKSFLLVMLCIVAIDAFNSIPFAYLRQKNKAYTFAWIKFLMTIITVFFNLFFLVVCPKINETHPNLISWFYNPSIVLGYVAIANLFSSVFALFALLKYFIHIKWGIDFALLKRMLKYSIPLLLLGITGVMNQSIDKLMFPFLFVDRGLEYANAQLGIYGTCFKLGLVMVMFTQAFRYAYEPFVFSKKGSKDDKTSYAEAMKFYIIVASIAFLGMMYFLDVIKYLIKPTFWEGLRVVPIVLLCYIFQGIYFNVSFWYKLTDRTIWGAIISGFGLILTIVGNILFVPIYGYMACAVVSCACFFFMMVFSWLMGRKYYPVNYDLSLIFRYIVIVGILTYSGLNLPIENIYILMTIRVMLLGIFIIYIGKKDIDIMRILKMRK